MDGNGNLHLESLPDFPNNNQVELFFQEFVLHGYISSFDAVVCKFPNADGSRSIADFSVGVTDWPVQADNHVCNCKFPMGTGAIVDGAWDFEACAFQFQVCALHVRSFCILAITISIVWVSCIQQFNLKCSGFLDVLALVFPFLYFSQSALGFGKTKNLATSQLRRFRHRPFRCLRMWLQRLTLSAAWEKQRWHWKISYRVWLRTLTKWYRSNGIGSMGVKKALLYNMSLGNNTTCVKFFWCSLPSLVKCFLSVRFF